MQSKAQVILETKVRSHVSEADLDATIISAKLLIKVIIKIKLSKVINYLCDSLSIAHVIENVFVRNWFQQKTSCLIQMHCTIAFNNIFASKRMLFLHPCSNLA